MTTRLINFLANCQRNDYKQGLILLLLSIVACSTPTVIAPKQQVQAPELPAIKASVIQVPIVLQTTALKSLLQRHIASPLLAGTTPTYHFKVANRKSVEKKNWLDRLAKPLLEWVDETIDASATFRYQLDLSELDIWFEGSKAHTDLKIDIRLEAEWENGLKWQGKKRLFNQNMACPLQIRVHMDGTVELTKEAELEVVLEEEQAQFEITKLCSSKLLQQVDWPELLEPIVKPVLTDLSQTINTILAQQFQQVLNSSTGQEYRSFRPLIDRAATYLNTPYALQEGIWLQPNVQQLFVSPLYGVGKGADNRLEASVGALAQPVVVLQTQAPKVGELPPVTFGIESPTAQSQLYVKGQLPLKAAAAQLQDYLSAYLATHYANYGYTVGTVDIYPRGTRAIVAIDLLRVKNQKKKATLYLSGTPQFDAATKEFYLEELKFTAQSKDLLLQLAKWLRQGQLMEQLQKNARFDATQEIQTIEQQLQQIDIRQSLGRIHGSLDQLQVVQTGISKAHFEAYLLATGVLQAEVYWQAW
ncbi:MAG: DUF4403 family protein [Aureispira sp.]